MFRTLVGEPLSVSGQLLFMSISSIVEGEGEVRSGSSPDERNDCFFHTA